MYKTGKTLTQGFNLAAHRPTGWREDFFINQYGHRLRYAHSPATTRDRCGTIVLTHGYGEFIDQYYLAIRDYQAMGYDVWALDHYGFGKSGRDDPYHPHRPSTKGLLRHVNDLQFFVEHIVQGAATRPLILSTHSMGGHIGLLHLQRHPGMFDAAIFSSPMFDVFRFGLPRAFRPAIRAVFNIASKIGFKDTPVPATPAMWDKITRAGHALGDQDRGGLRAAFKHLVQGSMPDIAVERPTFGWIAAAFRTITHSLKPKHLRPIQTPILIGSAGIESLVDVESHRIVAETVARAIHVTLPMAQHNLWFESDENHGEWLGHIRRFLGRTEPSGQPLTPAPDPQDSPRKAAIRRAFPG